MKALRRALLAAAVIGALVLPAVTLAAPVSMYAFVDGPLAGGHLRTNVGSDVVIIDRHASDARIVAADDDCDQPHVHGTIDGVPEPSGGCGWGRVVEDSKITDIDRLLAEAIGGEDWFLTDLRKDPPERLKEYLLLDIYADLDYAMLLTNEAATKGKISSGAADKITRRLKSAKALDLDVNAMLEAHPNPGRVLRQRMITEIGDALALKRKAWGLLMHAEKKASNGGEVPTPGVPSMAAPRPAATEGSVTVYWDVNVPVSVKAALCVAKADGTVTDHQHPVFPGVDQVQRCQVTNRTRIVHGVKKRIVHFEISVTGTLIGSPKPVGLIVYWSP